MPGKCLPFQIRQELWSLERTVMDDGGCIHFLNKTKQSTIYLQRNFQSNAKLQYFTENRFTFRLKKYHLIPSFNISVSNELDFLFCCCCRFCLFCSFYHFCSNKLDLSVHLPCARRCIMADSARITNQLQRNSGKVSTRIQNKVSFILTR